MVIYHVLFRRVSMGSDLRMRFSIPEEEDIEYWALEYARIMLPGWACIGWL